MHFARLIYLIFFQNRLKNHMMNSSNDIVRCYRLLISSYTYNLEDLIYTYHLTWWSPFVELNFLRDIDLLKALFYMRSKDILAQDNIDNIITNAKVWLHDIDENICKVSIQVTCTVCNILEVVIRRLIYPCSVM